MRISKKILLPFLFLLLIIIFTLMLKFKFKKEILQRNIDLAYTNAITNSIDGLARDYSSIDNNEKVQLYYKTLYNLKTVIISLNRVHQYALEIH